MVDGHLTDELVGPEAFEQFLFGDHSGAVLEQIGQDIEHLRFEFTEFPRMTEFIALRIECIVAKDVDHPATSVSLLPPGHCRPHLSGHSGDRPYGIWG